MVNSDLHKNLLHAVHPSAMVNLKLLHSFQWVDDPNFITKLGMWNLQQRNRNCSFFPPTNKLQKSDDTYMLKPQCACLHALWLTHSSI